MKDDATIGDLLELANSEGDGVSFDIDYFLITPNPTFGDLNIYFTSEIDGPAQIKLCDMLGRELRSMKVDAVFGRNKISIDVHSFAAATYVIYLETGERRFTKKFVKARF